MEILSWIKGVFNTMFAGKARNDFDIEFIDSAEMDRCIKTWASVYQGKPEWLDAQENIKTINFAKTICSETARLSTLDVGITMDGDARSEWLQQQTDKYILPMLRKWIELACAYGNVIIKPNGNGVDYFTPDTFKITDCDSNGRITGIVFQDSYKDKKKYYTKLEYHRFLDNVYVVSSRAYLSYSNGSIGDMIGLEKTKWSDLLPEVSITKANDEKIDAPLFGVLKMPMLCKDDTNSPMGASVFADAVEELKDLDIAYSRNSYELYHSRRIILADERIIEKPAIKTSDGEIIRPKLRLPAFIRNVFSEKPENYYQEIDPNLNTDVRKTGINQQLSFIGYKCGFSNGYFVFDEKTGMVTATQVESDDRRTIQLIKDIRDCTQNALDDMYYAMSVFADLYELAPAGEYEVNYAFGDITYNYQEDKMQWYQYATQGKVPFWLYLVKFEKMSEEEAKEVCEIAKKENKETGMYDNEE